MEAFISFLFPENYPKKKKLSLFHREGNSPTTNSMEKTLMLGKTEGKKEKRVAEDEKVG